MPTYEVDYTYSIPVSGSVTVDSEDLDGAEEAALKDIFLQASLAGDKIYRRDIDITGVKELTNGN